MTTFANQKRIIAYTVSCLAAIIPLPILGNGIALGQQYPINVPSPNELKAFHDKILLDTNTDRDIYQAAPLTQDPTLDAGAQAWAEHLAATDTFEHSSSAERNGAGENIYMGSTTDPSQSAALLAKSAVESWYAELGSYDFNAPGSTKNGTIGHFTQLVWQATTSIGCGTASVKEPQPVIYQGNSYTFYDYFVVCRYSPAGNVSGQYGTNVLRPKPGTKIQP